MKRKSKLVFLFFVILLGIIFSGCSSIGLGSNTKTNGISIGSGSSSSSDSGVVLEFGDINIEPQKGAPFPIPITIKNFQKHEINDLIIKPTNFDWGYVTGLQREYSENLPSALSSGPYVKSMFLQGISLDGFTSNYNFDPIFKYCYSAKTSFNEQVCIPDKYGKCDLKTDGGTQNGPISVNIVRIIPIGDREISVEFSLSDSLSGNVVNDCFQENIKMDYGNKYVLNEVKLGSDIGQCDSNLADDFTINQRNGRFVCTFKRSSDDVYTSQISIDLSYKYQQEAQKKILIRDLSVR